MLPSHRWLRSALALALAGIMLGSAVASLPASADAPPQSGFSASGKEADGRSPYRGGAHKSTAASRTLGTQATPAPECPPVLMHLCSFDPAAYALNDPNDITNYGNYDFANRPVDGTRIRGVTIHDIEGSCEAAVNAFKDPLFFVSSTYVICADGRIIQMVQLKNITWTAGNWWFNSHHIQIEHAGHATSPTEYTNQMYVSSAILVRWLSQKFGFPLDRNHVHGHDNVPAVRTSGIAAMHVDPGPFWDWEKYMKLLRVPIPSGSNHFRTENPKMVTIAPSWRHSREVVTGCTVSHEVPPPCVPPGSHATNFVYLRTAPSPTAPLITDVVTGPGSTEIENRSARAFYGQTFAVAGQRVERGGTWYKIWFSGQGAWFYSPRATPTAIPATGKCVTPKGSSAVAVYGRPVPELSEWPTLDFTPPAGSVPSPSPFPYTVQPGQCFFVIEAGVQADHYYTWSFDDTYDRFRVVGDKRYVWVQYNAREAFLEESLVEEITVR